MNDPYRTLNLSRNADAGQVKSAYRRLAKELHPDRNPGDRRAEQRFREVTQAYELLSDAEKRAAFDRGLIDGEGKPRGGFGFGGYGASGVDGGARHGFESIFEKAFGGGFAKGFGGGSGGAADMNGAFEELLRGRQGRAGASTRSVRGSDLRHRMEVDFLAAATGTRERVMLRNGRQLEVDVPAGTADGQVLRLRGQGHPGPGGGPAGDALVEISVRPHRHFERKGHDIHYELPVSLSEAVLGAKVKVPTIDGPVRVTIAPGANSGQSLRLRGKGIPFADGTRGDQYVRLIVVLPGEAERAAMAALRELAAKHSYDVRSDLETA